MAFYYAVLAAALLGGLLLYRKGKGGRRKVLYLAVTFLFLCAAMSIRKIGVGRDSTVYYAAFKLIAKESDFAVWVSIVKNAPLYCCLCKLISLVGDYRLMLVVTSAIILSAVAIYIYFFSDNVVFSTYCFVALYFYLHSFNISRQFLAVAFILYALCAKRNGKYALTAVCTAAAIGIHSISFLAVPVIFINYEKFSGKFLKAACIISVAFGALFNTVFPFAVDLFCRIFPRYNMYLGQNMHSVYDQSRGDNIYLNIFYLAVVVAGLIIQTNAIKNVRINGKDVNHLRYLLALVTVGVSLGISGGNYLALSRAIYFYQIHVICLLPNMFERFSRAKILLYFLFAVLLLIPFTICLMRNFSNVVPYEVFW